MLHIERPIYGVDPEVEHALRKTLESFGYIREKTKIDSEKKLIRISFYKKTDKTREE